MFELTEAQRSEVNGGAPVRAVDPVTRQTYVLVPEQDYERLKPLLTGEFHPSDAYVAIDRAFAEGWNDPKMNDYDRYEELKK